MKRPLKPLIDGKRDATEPIPISDQQKGFKGWYASKYLPHFDAPGRTQFLTWRLADAMPAERRHEWEGFLHLEDEDKKRKQIELYIDRGLGACHLRKPIIAEMVQSNLWHKDGKNYQLLAWSIMPNHVHVLIGMREMPLRKIVHSWKSYTAKQANKLHGLSGNFWSEDYFDRYIRDDEHFTRVRRYIENNPAKAGLVNDPADWPWSSARYRCKQDFSKLIIGAGTARPR